jgi:hypothetical protein
MEKNFGDIFEGLTIEEKDAVVFEIAQKCNLEMPTVRAWGKGIRHPRRRSREKAFDVLCERGLISRDCKLKFKD